MTTWNWTDGATFAFIAESVDIDLPSNKMELTVHGNYFAKLAQPFKAIFENELRA